MPTRTSASDTALTELYREHHPWLLQWLYKKLDCSWQSADMAQDTFVRLMTSSACQSQIQQLNQPRSFLATVARRVLIDHFRRKSLEQAWLEQLAAQPEPLAISAEEQTLILETLCRIDDMLEDLGDKVRQAFLMSQLEGMKYAEIAQALDVSVSSVKKYMARATEHCLLFMLEEMD